MSTELLVILLAITTFTLTIQCFIVFQQLCITNIADRIRLYRILMISLYTTLSIMGNILMYLSALYPDYTIASLATNISTIQIIIEAISICIGFHLFRIFNIQTSHKIYAPTNTYPPKWIIRIFICSECISDVIYFHSMDKLHQAEQIELCFKINILRIETRSEYAVRWRSQHTLQPLLYQQKIHCYERQQLIQLELDKACIESLNNDNVCGEFLRSDLYNNIWSMFCMVKDINHLAVYIQLHCLPFDIRTLRVQITFGCNINNIKKVITSELNHKNMRTESEDIMLIENLKKYKSIK
eukprot:234157_1